METLLVWVVRYGHVASASIWVGGYGMLVFVLLPLLPRQQGNHLLDVARSAVRLLTYAGTATIAFGVALTSQTRGFGNLFKGEWGMIVVSAFIIAVVLIGIGDGMLRSSLERYSVSGDLGPARRAAVLGLILGILAIGFMTRALYART